MQRNYSNMMPMGDDSLRRKEAEYEYKLLVCVTNGKLNLIYKIN